LTTAGCDCRPRKALAAPDATRQRGAELFQSQQRERGPYCCATSEKILTNFFAAAGALRSQAPVDSQLIDIRKTPQRRVAFVSEMIRQQIQIPGPITIAARAKIGRVATVH
jgi:hypothetical protein